jgi:hypothetical protein
MVRASGRQQATTPGATPKKLIFFVGDFCRFGKPE